MNWLRSVRKTSSLLLLHVYNPFQNFILYLFCPFIYRKIVNQEVSFAKKKNLLKEIVLLKYSKYVNFHLTW